MGVAKLATQGRDVREGWELMVDLSNEETVLMTGGPVTNLGRAIAESLKPGARKRLLLGRWAGQGGFAGANIVPASANTLKKFQGKQTCPTFNFDCSRPDALAALKYDGIRERFLCSKNVCHQVVYDEDLAHRVAKHVEQRESLAPQGEAVIASLGLPLFHEMMGVYRNAKNKALHDLVAGLCAIDPVYSGCGFRRAQLELMKAENKEGLEWGCRYAVGPTVWPTVVGDSQFSVESSEACETNVWISVDVDIERFKHCLVGNTPISRP